jgi:hypothetical protein
MFYIEFVNGKAVAAYTSDQLKAKGTREMIEDAKRRGGIQSRWDWHKEGGYEAVQRIAQELTEAARKAHKGPDLCATVYIGTDAGTMYRRVMTWWKCPRSAMLCPTPSTGIATRAATSRR